MIKKPGNLILQPKLRNCKPLKTAIVILNWNGKDHLRKYLPELIEHTNTEKHQLIVADNGSTDDSLLFLKNEYPVIQIIKLDKNYGFAGGYNKALEQVDADIYCLLNSDVRVTNNWLEPVLEYFKNQEIAAVQPKILSDRDWSRFEHAGAAGGFIDKYGYPFCRGRIMNVIEYDKGQYNKTSDIFWASGACMFIRAELFRTNRGFDAGYFAHMEEIDLCWRLKNQGYRIVYAPNSKVYHYGGATLDYNNPRKLFLNFRNSLWTLYKNYTGKHLRILMLKRMLIDTAAILKFLASFQLKNSMAVINAHLAYYGSKKELRQKRKLLQSGIKVRSHSEIFNKSIVLNFFINSHKTFAQLKEFKNKVNRKAKRRAY